MRRMSGGCVAVVAGRDHQPPLAVEVQSADLADLGLPRGTAVAVVGYHRPLAGVGGQRAVGADAHHAPPHVEVDRPIRPGLHAAEDASAVVARRAAGAGQQGRDPLLEGKRGAEGLVATREQRGGAVQLDPAHEALRAPEHAPLAVDATGR